MRLHLDVNFNTCYYYSVISLALISLMAMLPGKTWLRGAVDISESDARRALDSRSAPLCAPPPAQLQFYLNNFLLSLVAVDLCGDCNWGADLARV